MYVHTSATPEVEEQRARGDREAANGATLRTHMDAITALQQRTQQHADTLESRIKVHLQHIISILSRFYTDQAIIFGIYRHRRRRSRRCVGTRHCWPSTLRSTSPRRLGCYSIPQHCYYSYQESYSKEAELLRARNADLTRRLEGMGLDLMVD